MAGARRGSRTTATKVTLAATLLLVALSAPTAAAAEAIGGILDVASPVFLEGSSDLHLSAQAILAPDLSRGAAVHLEAKSAYVCYAQRTFAFVQGPLPATVGMPQRSDDCSQETDFVLDAVGSAQGSSSVGWYVEHAAPATLVSDHVVVTPHAGARLTSYDSLGGSSALSPEGNPPYVVDIDHPVLVVNASGSLRGTFGGSLKIHGLPVHTSSSAGTHDYQTGEENATGAAGTQANDWLFVTAENATFRIATPASFQVATGRVSGATLGAVRFSAMGGSLASVEARYAPSATKADSVTGRFDAAFTPAPDGSGRLELRGQMLSTSLSRAPLARSPLVSGIPGWTIPLGLGVVGLAGGGAVLLHRRRAGPSGMLRRAEAACRHGMLDEGLSWVERACEADPRDHGAFVWAALLHRRLGNAQKARSWMEHAARIAPPGEGRPDYLLACLVMETLDEDDRLAEATHQQALMLIATALKRAPGLAGEIESEGLFAPLRGEDLAALLAEARERAPPHASP